MRNNKKKSMKKEAGRISAELASSLQKPKKQADAETYKLTPKGALWLALIDVYKDEDVEKLEQFQKLLVENLSLVFSDGKTEKFFGKDLNEMMTFIGNMIAMAEDMYEKLHENDVDFDCKDYGFDFREDGFNDTDPQEEDDDNID